MYVNTGDVVLELMTQVTHSKRHFIVMCRSLIAIGGIYRHVDLSEFEFDLQWLFVELYLLLNSESELGATLYFPYGRFTLNFISSAFSVA